MNGDERCARTREQVAVFLAGTDLDDHAARCPACARLLRDLREEPAVGPDLGLRLLESFRRWRDGPA